MLKRGTPVLSIAVLVIAVVAAIALVRGTGGSDYEVRLRMPNASQLVRDARVEVAGVRVGTVKSLKLADDGQAEVRLKITDDRFVPLREGTRATVRLVGQATTTNRFVDLGLAPDSAPAIPDGGELATADVRGAVDLDSVIGAMDEPFRRDLSGLIKRGSEIYAGSGSRAFNQMLARLDPAMAAFDDLLKDVNADRDALTSLIRVGSTAAGAVASRRTDLESATAATARTLSAVSHEREALATLLTTAPEVLKQAERTFSGIGDTAEALRPALRRVPASQAQLRLLLRRLPRTFPRTERTARQVTELLPSADRTLRDIIDIEPATVQAVDGIAGALRRSMPILEGVRFYGSDLILGIFTGLMAIGTGTYNEQGRYLKLEFVQNAQTLLGGALSPLLPGITDLTGGLVPGVVNVARRQEGRCPGGNAPPAPDGSNPWYPKEGICDPTQSMSGLVNNPSAFCLTMVTCIGDRRSLTPEPDVESTSSTPRTTGGTR